MSTITYTLKTNVPYAERLNDAIEARAAVEAAKVAWSAANVAVRDHKSTKGKAAVIRLAWECEDRYNLAVELLEAAEELIGVGMTDGSHETPEELLGRLRYFAQNEQPADPSQPEEERLMCCLCDREWDSRTTDFMGTDTCYHCLASDEEGEQEEARAHEEIAEMIATTPAPAVQLTLF